MALARPHHRISPERIHNGYPTTIQEQSDSNVEEIDEEDEVSSEDEKTPLLGLPEPEPTQPPTPEGWSHTLRLWGWRVPARLPRVIWIRTLKSSILVGKVSGTAFLLLILLRLNVCRSLTTRRLRVGAVPFACVSRNDPAACSYGRGARTRGDGHLVRRARCDASARGWACRAAVFSVLDGRVLRVTVTRPCYPVRAGTTELSV